MLAAFLTDVCVVTTLARARETLRCRHVDKPGGCCGISHLWHAHGPCFAQPDLHCACFILAMRAAPCADHFGAPLLPDLPAPSAGGHDWRKRYRGACTCFWTKPFDEQDPEVLPPTSSASTGTPQWTRALMCGARRFCCVGGPQMGRRSARYCSCAVRKLLRVACRN